MIKKVSGEILFLGLGLLFYSGISYGFWSVMVPVIGGGRIHQEITQEALTEISFNSNRSSEMKFLKHAIKEVNRANQGLDVYVPAIIGEYNEWQHFDNESFMESRDFVREKRKNIIKLLESDNPWGREFLGRGESRPKYRTQELVWIELGEALHTSQDFYSHSIWVEQGHNQPIDILSEAAMVEFANSNAIGDVCSDPSTLVNQVRLTSGYYPGDTPPVGKCKHGDLYETIDHCSNKLFSPRPGINKDNPNCVSLSFHRTHAAKARILAIKETIIFVQSIIDELSDRETPAIAGICVLMGVDRNGCPNEETWVGIATQEPGGTHPEFDYSMVIKRVDGKITGIAKVSIIGNSQYYGNYNLQGTYEGNKLSIRETYVGGRPQPGTFWCRKQIEATIEGNVLTAEWTAPSCAPGGLNLELVAGDS